jgi:hypothetical protein
MGGLKLWRELITAGLPKLLVLFAIHAVRLGKDLPGELLVVTRGVLRGIRVHLRSIDRDQPDLHQSSLRTQLQHLTEQIGERRLVALAKARDRRVIGPLVRRDHAVGDVLYALALDHPRGALPLAVGVEQQREHHPGSCAARPWPSLR